MSKQALRTRRYITTGVPVLVAAVSICAVGAPLAFAALLSGHAYAREGHPPFGHPGTPARSIRSISTTYDDTTYVWTASITFYAPQSAATAAKLYVGIATDTVAYGDFQTHTNPSRPGTVYYHATDDPKTGVTPPALSGSAVNTIFNAKRTTLILAVRDPYLADLPTPTRVDLRLSQHNVIYDQFIDIRLR